MAKNSTSNHLQIKTKEEEEEEGYSKPKYDKNQGPPSFMRGPPGPQGHITGKAKLDHPRKVLWKWLFSYITPYKQTYILYFIFLIIGTAIFSYTPVLTSTIIDRGIIGKDEGFFLKMVIIYVILMNINALINWLANYGMSKIGQVIVFNVRNQLFQQMQDMSLAYFDKRSSGDIMSIMTNDVDQLNQLVAGQLVQILTQFVSIILTIVFMFILNPILAAMSLLMIPIFILMIKLFQKKVSGVFKETRKTISKVTSSIQENVAGAKIIQAYGQQKKTSTEFDEANKANYNANVKARKVFATFFPFVQFITTIITVSILLTGGYLALNNVTIFGISVTIGVLTAFVVFLAEFFRPFMMLMQIQQVVESSLAASDRIYGLLEERVEIKDPEHPKLFNIPVKGEIKFEDVYFGYLMTGPEEKKQVPININHNMGPMTPEMILNIGKNLGKILQNQDRPKTIGGNMNGDMGGGNGMNFQSPQELIKMLSKISITSEIFEQLPINVQNAINEQKKLDEYEKARGYILEHLNLTIKAGTTLAIVGETGAGKTTIIKLISRFYDIIKGQLLIDGIDIRDVKKRDLRRLLGIVPQDAFLFTGSIRDNLLYGIGTMSPEIEQKMIEISKFLGLHNFIETLPEKYDTHLTENAANISIGQRQLIAFARALITDPIILMLDEATSSVDPYTETLIQDALDKARKQRTTIIVAHRLSTIKNADHIIVIGKEKHGILEEGTHNELIKMNGKYKRLLDMQRREIEVT